MNNYSLNKPSDYYLEIFSLLVKANEVNKGFIIKATTKTKGVLDAISLNLNEFKNSDYSLREKFKKYPLLKMKEAYYTVIDWNYFSEKLAIGIQIDFYNNSEIKEIFKTSLDFKQHLGQAYIENYLFREIIKVIFNKKFHFYKFDENETQGFPDAYIRVNKKIFLIEIKDASMPISKINSFNYETIKQDIDLKFNSKRKGIKQLVKTIKLLSEKPNIFESHLIKNNILRNSTIYPIMIYTDRNYNIPGVFTYLQENFDSQVNIYRKNFQFKKIKPLSFINIDFLISRLALLSNDLPLDKCIDNVLTHQVKLKNKFIRSNSTDDLDELNMDFTIIHNMTGIDSDVKKDYVKILLDKLDFIKELKELNY